MRMMKKLCWVATAAVGLLACAAEDETGVVIMEAKPGAHFVGDPYCELGDESLTCVGTVAGLGNRAVTVNIDVETTCTNTGQGNGNHHQPGGLAHGSTGPIDPENGRIDFDVTVSSNCPDTMTVGFESPAYLTILQGSQEVFTATIAF